MTRTELEETAAACGVDLSMATHQAELIRSVIDSIAGKSEAEALATLLHRDGAVATDGSVISDAGPITEDSPHWRLAECQPGDHSARQSTHLVTSSHIRRTGGILSRFIRGWRTTPSGALPAEMLIKGEGPRHDRAGATARLVPRFLRRSPLVGWSPVD